MKITDAFWEKRNLGVDTVEFTIEEGDTEEAIVTALRQNEKGYNVVKLPASMAGLSFTLHGLGYAYVECVCHLVHDLKNVSYTPMQKRLTESVAYELMDEGDYAELFSEIRKGMFRTDRVALDPAFGVRAANERYVNWIKDEAARGTDVYKMLYKGGAIGFFAFKQTEPDVYFPFLVGLYEKYSRSGLGINVTAKSLEEALRRNAKRLSTYISMNNKAPLCQALSMGYTINGISSVLVKHGGNCGGTVC